MPSRPACHRRQTPWAAAVLSVWVLAQAGCVAREPALPPCPDRHREDADRTRRIREALDATARGRELLRRADGSPPLRVCYGRVDEPGITPERVVLLDDREGDAESAARLGHLLLHAIEGLPMDPSGARGRPCDERVAEAVEVEARAHALELELRRDLGVTAPRARFAFEDAFWAAPADRRVEVIRAWLEAHPRGGAGVPGFIESYGRACREGR
jgi:hypothetical protein